MSSRRPIVAALVLALVALAAVAGAPALAAENGTWGISDPAPAHIGFHRAATADGHKDNAAIAVRPAPGSPLATRGGGLTPAASGADALAFGTGARSARAERLVDDAVRLTGHSRADLVDVVEYVAQGNPHFFVRADGTRVIQITDRVFKSTWRGQIRFALHELAHAEQWQAALRHFGGRGAARQGFFGIRRESLRYALREVGAEGRARQWLIDGLPLGLSPQLRRISERYTRIWLGAVRNRTP